MTRDLRCRKLPDSVCNISTDRAKHDNSRSCEDEYHYKLYARKFQQSRDCLRKNTQKMMKAFAMQGNFDVFSQQLRKDGSVHQMVHRLDSFQHRHSYITWISSSASKLMNMSRVRSFTTLLLIPFSLFCISVTGASASLCTDPTSDLLQRSIYRSYLPKGAMKAGTFHKAGHSHDPESCIQSCCQLSECNVAFLVNTTCYLIACFSVESCRPKPAYKSKYSNVYTVIVRSVDADESPSHDVGFRPKPCEVGLLTCPENQFCAVPHGSKSRNGKCICKPGYRYDKKKRRCRGKIVLTTFPPTTPTTASSYIWLNDSTTISSHIPKSSVSSTHISSTASVVTSVKSTQQKTEHPVVKLSVSAGTNKTIRLPEDSVSLTAYVLPAPSKGDLYLWHNATFGETYHYEWAAIKRPKGSENVYMKNLNTDTLQLSKLIAGLYTFKIKVTDDTKYGEATVNVTVLPAKRVNKPPVAVVKPTNQNVTLPDNVLIYGDGSTDDDKIVSYHWEEVSGPLQATPVDFHENPFIINNLTPGKYVFKLTVTDSDGATSSALANVSVLPEVDNPPKAVVGSDVVITLPQDSVVLHGNLSYDDHGIVSYKWSSKSGSPYSGDMKGAQSAHLHLSNLEEGSFSFVLEVEDKAHQKDTDDVTVIVKPPRNQRPKAVAGTDKILYLPFDAIILDGRNSTDDLGITSYHWQQIGDMQSPLTIADPDTVLTKATGSITPGHYTFQLKVTDSEKLESTASVTYTVIQTSNSAPVADAGADRVIQLPVSLVTLDGRGSHDDRGIVKYLWTRGDQSVAAGDVLNASDHHPVLLLTNIVSGHYTFMLTVTDAAGLSGSDTVNVVVKSDMQQDNILELVLDTSLVSFTQENKNNLVKQLKLLLNNPLWQGETSVHIVKLTSDSETQRVLVQFLVQTTLDGKVTVQKGVEVLSLLKKKFGSQSDILDYRIITLDTLVCQRNCSGHGHCHPLTKLCVCEAFWMPNIFTANFGLKESNCDWSILYVVVIIFIIVVFISGFIWIVIYMCRRKSPCRCHPRTRRLRYSLLRNRDDDNDELELTKRRNASGKSQQSSLMVSDSELSSEDETLFVSQKKTNGNAHRMPNGLNKSYTKNKIKA